MGLHLAGEGQNPLLRVMEGQANLGSHIANGDAVIEVFNGFNENIGIGHS